MYPYLTQVKDYGEHSDYSSSVIYILNVCSIIVKNCLRASASQEILWWDL